MYSKQEVIKIVEAVGLATPSFVKLDYEYEVVWHVSTQDLKKEADAVEEALKRTDLEYYNHSVYTTSNKTGGQVIVYVQRNWQAE